MKIISISVVKVESGKATIISSASDLSSYGFFERSTVKNLIEFITTTVSERTQPGQRQTIEQEGLFGHVHGRAEGIACMMVCDSEYPSRAAFSLLTKLGDDFISQIPKQNWTPGLTFQPLEQYLVKYQDPSQADPIMKVQKELDQTKIIMHKTIESVLQRGEKLDDLVNRSEQLTMQSKMFYKSAKSTNSCCRMS